MTIRLRDYSASFATREKAREVIASVPGGRIADVDVDGVLCSPSFLAELMVQLTKNSDLTVTTTDRTMADKVERLSSQLGLTGKISVHFAVSA